MSSKTKAKELTNQMHKLQLLSDIPKAKECAKIVCDEILGLLTLYNPQNAFNDLQTKEYWYNVKKEIDKL